MCYFVYIGVPARALPALVDAFAGLQCQKVNDPRLRALFPPGDVVTEVTAGGCSCSLYAERPSRSNKRAQYEAKGWSESKILRALADARPETPSESTRTWTTAGGKQSHRITAPCASSTTSRARAPMTQKYYMTFAPRSRLAPDARVDVDLLAARGTQPSPPVAHVPRHGLVLVEEVLRDKRERIAHGRARLAVGPVHEADRAWLA
jgi:hypothetical protein